MAGPVFWQRFEWRSLTSWAGGARSTTDGLDTHWRLARSLLLLLALLTGIKAVMLHDVSQVERDLMQAGVAARADVFRAALDRLFAETPGRDLDPAAIDVVAKQSLSGLGSEGSGSEGSGSEGSGSQGSGYIVTITQGRTSSASTTRPDRVGPDEAGALLYTSDATSPTRQAGLMRPLSRADRSAGDWQIDIRHRLGTIDQLVHHRRRRDLGIGLALLALLGASVVLLLASARGQHRVAQQQMAFVAAVSHELRTPLAAICSAGENLADGVVSADDRVKAYGTILAREGARLADMVERVLEYAGILSGAAGHTRVAIDPSRLVADVLDDVGLRGLMRDRAIHVDVDLAESLPPIVGHPEELRAALLNVVGNAVKYSVEGGRVLVSVRLREGRIAMVVTDRGLGIDGEDLPRVFDPFFRGRRAVQAQIRGTGVGLSVVRRAVTRHEGTVHVASRVGHGTTVTIELPADAAAGALDRGRVA